MSINFRAVPTEETLIEAMKLGEGQQIEFKSTIPDAASIAKHISAFANTTGGWIIIGVREHPPEIIGCDFSRLLKVIDRASEIVKPAGVAELHRVDVSGKTVAVISVRSSGPVVATQDGVFERVGEQIKTISFNHAKEKLTADASPGTETQVAEALVELTDTIQSLRRDLQYSQSFMSQLPNILISFVVGCITGVIGNYIFKALGNWIITLSIADVFAMFLTFIVDMTKALAWPAVVVWVVWTLRDSLRDVVRRLTRVKGAGVEAEFSDKVRRIEEEAEIAALPAVANLPAPPSVETAEDKYRRLCEVSPELAVIEAWRQIEHAAATVFPSERGFHSRLELRAHLKNVLDEPSIKLVEELRNLRNEVSHHMHVVVSAEDAYRYAMVAVRVAEKIRESESRK